MTKINMSTAKQLISMFEDIYQNDRTEWFHVRTTENKILMEVNLYYSYVRVFVDYKSNCFVYLDKIEGFDIHEGETGLILRVKQIRQPICPFCVDIEED